MSRPTAPRVHFADEAVTLWHGDAAATLQLLEPGSVDCIVTSPPYYGLRDYGVDGQIGAEESPDAYVDALVEVFTQAHRVLAADGTLWLNLGDSYAGRANAGREFTKNRGRNVQSVGYPAQRNMTAYAPYKSMLGMPWRVALALIETAWILRNDVVWAKPNAMPESVDDRLAARYEHVFLLVKAPTYWFDLDPIRVPHHPDTARRYSQGFKTSPVQAERQTFGDGYGDGGVWTQPSAGRNPGDVWTIPTSGFPEAHFATMPPALAERCVLAGCKPGGTVLDPFSGSGTTGMAASKHDRQYVGIDLSAEYLDLSLRTRLVQPALEVITPGGAR